MKWLRARLAERELIGALDDQPLRVHAGDLFACVGEPAIVIGRGTRHTPAAQSGALILGHPSADDLTAIGLLNHDPSFTRRSPGGRRT